MPIRYKADRETKTVKSDVKSLPLAMTWEEIKAHHRDAIKRQAIMFYKSKNVFDGEPRKIRWELCVEMIVEAWIVLGPQRDHVPTRTFHLPDQFYANPIQS